MNHDDRQLIFEEDAKWANSHVRGLRSAFIAIFVTLAVAALLFSMFGCGNPRPTASASIQRDTVTMPVVEFVGDEISQAIVTASQNPRWHCADCSIDAGSEDALMGFTGSLASKPDVIVILTGTRDITSDVFSGTSGNQTGFDCKETDLICVNVVAMITQAQSAGARVILGTLPPFGPGPDAEIFNDCCNVGYEIQGNQDAWNNRLLAAFPPGNAANVTVVDYASELEQLEPSSLDWGPIQQYVPGLSDDGIDPNAAGTSIMLTMVSTAITGLHVGSGPR